MTETPCVFMDVQRGGPSTGLPTLPAQADMMQVRWGSHGDYEIIALCPNSPQECFDLTIKAFNLSEKYRVPGVRHAGRSRRPHDGEGRDSSAPSRSRSSRAATPHVPPGEFNAYEPGEDLVPDMPHVGEGYNVHVTGLTHDERGYPDMTPGSAGHAGPAAAREDQQERRQDRALRRRADRRRRVVVVSYGITSRVAQRAIEMARDKGVKVGKFRLITAWPFPEKQIAEIAAKVKAIVVRRVESRPDGARSRARRGRKSRRPLGRTRRWQRSPSGRHSAGHHGGGAMSDVNCHIRQSRRAVPAHGPHPAHLVSGMRHRHQRELFCARPDRRQGGREEPGHRLRHRLHRPRRRIHEPGFVSHHAWPRAFPSPPA